MTNDMLLSPIQTLEENEDDGVLVMPKDLMADMGLQMADFQQTQAQAVEEDANVDVPWWDKGLQDVKDFVLDFGLFPVQVIAGAQRALPLAAAGVQRGLKEFGEKVYGEEMVSEPLVDLGKVAEDVTRPDTAIEMAGVMPTEGQELALGLGGTLALGATAVVSPGLGIMTTAGLGREEFYRDAKAHGADEDTALLAGDIGATVGLTDMLGFASALQVMKGTTAGKEVFKDLAQAVRTGSVEAMQEAFQEYAKNETAIQLEYDKERERLEGVGPSLQQGFTVGVGMDLFANALGLKKIRMPPKNPMNPMEEPAYVYTAGGRTEPERIPEVTTKVLDALGNKHTFKRTTLEQQLNRQEITESEKQVIRAVADGFQGDVLPTDQFKQMVEAQLFPLKKVTTGEYADYGLRNIDRQAVKLAKPSALKEGYVGSFTHIWQAPFDTPGYVNHFGNKNYVAHTRGFEEASTRYIVEVQSDLAQKVSTTGDQTNGAEYQRLQRDAEIMDRDMAELETHLTNPDAERAQDIIQRYDPGMRFATPEQFSNWAWNVREAIEVTLRETQTKLAAMERITIDPRWEPVAPHIFKMAVRAEMQDAARGGQDTLRLATADTVAKVERWYEYSAEHAKEKLLGKVFQPSTPRTASPIEVIDVAATNFGTLRLRVKFVNSDFGKQEFNVSKGVIERQYPGLHEVWQTLEPQKKLRDKTEGLFRRHQQLEKTFTREYGGVKVVDEKGHSWVEAPVKADYARKPLEFFSFGGRPQNPLALAQMMERIAGREKLTEAQKDALEKIRWDMDSYGKAMKWTAPLIWVRNSHAHIKGVRDYVDATREQSRYVSRFMWRANETAKMLNKLKKAEGDALGKFATGVTLKDDAIWVKEGRHLTPQEVGEIAKQYNMTQPAMKVYMQMRNDMRHVLEEMRVALTEEAYATLSAEVAAVKEKEYKAEFASLMKSWYFPLERFGEHIVIVKAAKPLKYQGQSFKEGDTVLVESHDYKWQKGKRLASLKKHFGERAVVSGSQWNKENVQMFHGLPPSFALMLRDKLNLTAEQKEQLDDVVHSLAPGQSFRKHFMKRHGLLGYSENAVRSYASYMFKAAHHLGKAKYRGRLERAMDAVKETRAEMRAVGMDDAQRFEIEQHLRDHFDYMYAAENEWAKLRGMFAHYYLWANVKSAIVNATQVPLATHAYLGQRFGEVGAVKEIGQAYMDVQKLWMKAEPLPKEPGLYEAIEKAKREGFLDESLATDLAAMQEGNAILRALPRTAAGKMLRTASIWGMVPFQLVEKLNRYTTFMAAYRLHAKDAVGFSQESFDFANRAVEDTQHEYSRWNRPRLMRGKKSIAFLFQNFVAGQLWFIRHDPARLRYLAGLLLAGGIMGLPFADDIEDILNAIIAQIKKASGKEVTKTDLEMELREFIGELADPEIADIFLHGFARDTFGTGLDLSASISLGNIIPLTNIGQQSSLEGSTAQAMKEFGGAATAAAMNVWKAVYSDDPNELRRVQNALPASARNVVKGMRQMMEGGTTTQSGAVLPGTEVDMTDPGDVREAVAQMLGFTPTRVSRAWDVYVTQQDHADYFRGRQKVLVDAWKYARSRGDKEAVADVRRRIGVYNSEVPSPRLRITGEMLVDSLRTTEVQNRMKERGMPVQEKFRDLYEEVREAYP